MPFVEVLAAYHNRKSFDCGKEPLNRFLQQQARQNADRYLGVTHTIVENEGDSKILAYYTLVTSVVEPSIAPEQKLPRTGSVGVVLLGRLATDLSAQGRGLGRQMVLRAMSQTAQAAKVIGIYVLTLHALDAQARDWYLGLDYGFRVFADDASHLYVPLSYIAQLDLPAPTNLL